MTCFGCHRKRKEEKRTKQVKNQKFTDLYISPSLTTHRTAVSSPEISQPPCPAGVKDIQSSLAKVPTEKSNVLVNP
jgi:hypothetical protein